LAQPEILRGRVVKIADGDTLTVLDRSNRQHKIRLVGIDAPERKQPFHTKSRQNLADLVFGKEVAVEWHKRDRYKRILGKVVLDGQDVNLAQIRAGLAWHYKQYGKA
jgi:endonuclease YncB( thermonuclease family)